MFRNSWVTERVAASQERLSSMELVSFFNWVESSWVHSAQRSPMTYCASPGWLWWSKNWWNNWQGKPKYSEKTCPSTVLSTTNPTCCPDANPGRRGGKPASYRLSYGTAELVARALESAWEATIRRIGAVWDVWTNLSARVIYQQIRVSWN
jgi:hypothetical protein